MRTQRELTTADEALAWVDPEAVIFAVNSKSGRAAVVVQGLTTTDDKDHMIPAVRLIRPEKRTIASLKGFEESAWEPTDRDRWRAAWDKEIAEADPWITRELVLVAGLLLPIWSSLPDKGAAVRRLKVPDGRRWLGRLLDPGQVPALKVALGLSDIASAYGDPDRVSTVVLKDGSAIGLAGGLWLRRARVMDRYRMEVVGAAPQRSAFQALGLFHRDHQLHPAGVRAAGSAGRRGGGLGQMAAAVGVAEGRVNQGAGTTGTAGMASGFCCAGPRAVAPVRGGRDAPGEPAGRWVFGRRWSRPCCTRSRPPADPPRPGVAIQTVTPLGPDTVAVTTASHGGLRVSLTALARIREPLRETPYSRGGWFEEDCDWCIPYLVLGLDAFEPDAARGAECRAAARATLARFHPTHRRERGRHPARGGAVMTRPDQPDLFAPGVAEASARMFARPHTPSVPFDRRLLARRGLGRGPEPGDVGGARPSRPGRPGELSQRRCSCGSATSAMRLAPRSLN